MLWRYVRQFVKMDAKEALQYICCVCLSADQGDGVGQEQVEGAWELVRRIIILANAGAAWEELVGGLRPDGTRFVGCFSSLSQSNDVLTPCAQAGVIEQSAPLLKLPDMTAFNEHILARAAHSAEQADRLPEAVKLYNLAGEYATVVACLARALGGTLVRPTADESAHAVERTAAEIVRHYERTNRAVGKDREAVIRMLRIRDAAKAKEAGRLDLTLDVSLFLRWFPFQHKVIIDGVISQIMENTSLIPLDGDVARVTRKAEEFKDLHEALQRNLQTYLTLTMDAIAGLHQKTKSSMWADASKQAVRAFCHRCGNQSLTVLLHSLEITGTAHEIARAHDVRGRAQISHVAGCVFIPCQTGRRDLLMRYSQLSLMIKRGTVPCERSRDWADIYSNTDLAVQCTVHDQCICMPRSVVPAINIELRDGFLVRTAPPPYACAI